MNSTKRITITRTTLKQRQKMREQQEKESQCPPPVEPKIETIEPVKTKEQTQLPTQELIEKKNLIIKDLIAQYPHQQLTVNQGTKNKTTRTTTVLIPLNELEHPTMERIHAARYLINIENCTHESIHQYSALTNEDLETKAIKYITPEAYGSDYPIVSVGNLIYCRQCTEPIKDIIEKSQPRGVMKFISSPDTRHYYSHVKIPDYIIENEMIFTHNDDLWINISIVREKGLSPDELRELILSKYPRKNYFQVVAPPPPFEAECSLYTDFGVTSFLVNMCSYDDQFTIFEDLELPEEPPSSDDDYDDYDSEPIPKANVIRIKLKRPQPQPIPEEPEQPPEPEQQPEPEIIAPEPEIPDPIEPPQTPEPPADQHYHTFRYPMKTLSDFNNNAAYFEHVFNLRVSMSTCGEDIVVMTTADVAPYDKYFIETNLEQYRLTIIDDHKLTTLTDGELIDITKFTLTRKEPVQPEPQPEPPQIVQQPRTIEFDNMLNSCLSHACDEQSVQLVNILEKTYYHNLNANNHEPIIFNFSDLEKCENIAPIDKKLLSKTNLIHYYPDPHSDTFNDYYARLLVHLKYISNIPTENIIALRDQVVIHV